MTAIAVDRSRTAPAVPPWMLLWLTAYVITLPQSVAWWWDYLADLSGTGTYSADVAESPSFGLLRLLALVQLLPTIMLLAGVLAVLLPHLRARVVERMHGLIDAPNRALVREVSDFLQSIGVDVEVRVNLGDTTRLARVYAAGWRRGRLALFGQFAVLWRSDRSAAEAVLLHEVAHTRTGDHLLLGLGSPFVALVNLWLPVFAAFGALPLVVFAAVQYPTAGELAVQLILLATLLPRMLLLPVVALWSAEISADRFVTAHGRGQGLLAALDRDARSPHRLRRALLHLSHPPRRLRRWAAGDGWGRTVVLLSAWPLTCLALLGVILAGAVPAWHALGVPAADIAGQVDTGVATFLADSAKLWLPAAALLLVWPLLARLWESLWSHTAAVRPPIVLTGYLAAAGLVTVVMGSLLLLVA